MGEYTQGSGQTLDIPLTDNDTYTQSIGQTIDFELREDLFHVFSETLTLSDNRRMFLRRNVSDTVSLSDVVDDVEIFSRTFSESLLVSDDYVGEDRFEDGDVNEWSLDLDINDSSSFVADNTSPINGTYSGALFVDNGAVQYRRTIVSPQERKQLSFKIRVDSDTGNQFDGATVNLRDSNNNSIGELVFEDGSNAVTWDTSLTSSVVASDYWVVGKTHSVTIVPNSSGSKVDIFVDGVNRGTFSTGVTYNLSILRVTNNTSNGGGSRTAYFDDFLVGSKGFSYVADFFRTYTDTATITDTVLKKVEKPLADTLTLSDDKVKRVFKLLDEDVFLSDTRRFQLSKGLSDTLNVSDTLFKTVERSLSEVVTLSDAVLPVRILEFSESITLNDSVRKFVDVAPFTETLSLTDERTTALFITFSETVNVSDVVSRFLPQFDIFGVLTKTDFRFPSLTETVAGFGELTKTEKNETEIDK